MAENKTVRGSQATAHRRGQALVEFAIISFVLSAIVAGLLGIMVLALGSFQNNIAAESAGRILNKVLDHDLADAEEVYEALKSGSDPIYDEKYLLLSVSQYYDSTFKSNLPPLNRMLLASFVYDVDRDQYRFPGAVVTNADGDETVLIPLLPNASVSKGIDRADSVAVGTSFPVASNWVAPVTVAQLTPASSGIPGSCTLAFFYPSQPSSMINLELTRDVDGRVIFQEPVEADDSILSLGSLPAGYVFATAVPEKSIASTNRGQYGLGETYALMVSVRPFRLVFETATSFQLTDPPVP